MGFKFFPNFVGYVVRTHYLSSIPIQLPLFIINKHYGISPFLSITSPKSYSSFINYKASSINSWSYLSSKNLFLSKSIFSFYFDIKSSLISLYLAISNENRIVFSVVIAAVVRFSDNLSNTSNFSFIL